MKVELIYDADCRNVTPARTLLIKAFTRTGISARWLEWERSAPESLEYARTFGSPTILVNGKDVARPMQSPDRAPAVFTIRARMPAKHSCLIQQPRHILTADAVVSSHVDALVTKIACNRPALDAPAIGQAVNYNSTPH